MAWKITRPIDSDRVYAFGVELKAGESTYIDDSDVAAKFGALGWKSVREDAPAGVLVIRCKSNPSLRAIMDPVKLKQLSDPKGPWKVTSPDNWTRIYVNGYETCNGPFIVKNSDDMIVFKDLGFTVEETQLPPEPALKVAPRGTYTPPGNG